MGRIRKGSIVEREGKLYAVIQYVDETGRKRGIWRKAQDRKDARGIIKQVLRDLDDHGVAAVDAQNMTFAELAAHFEQHYLKAAEYTAEGGLFTEKQNHTRVIASPFTHPHQF